MLGYVAADYLVSRVSLVLPTLGHQLRRADQRIQAVKVHHPVLEGRRGLVRVQAGVVALQRVRHGAGRAAGEDHDAKAALLQLLRALDGCLAAFHHIGQQRDAVGKALAGCVHLFRGAQGRRGTRAARPAMGSRWWSAGPAPSGVLSMRHLLSRPL